VQRSHARSHARKLHPLILGGPMAVGFVTGCGTGSAEYGVVRQSAPVQVDAVERVHGGTAVLRCGPRPDAGE